MNEETEQYSVPDATGYSNEVPVTGNDKVVDSKLGTSDLSGLSIPARPGQGAKL